MLYVEDRDITCEMISKGFIIIFCLFNVIFYVRWTWFFTSYTIFIDMHDICTAVSAYELQLPWYAGAGATIVLPFTIVAGEDDETKNEKYN